MSQPLTGHGTVGKAVEVLDLVASHDRPVRFAELRTQSDFPKATLYRLIQTLVGLRLLTFDPERQTYAPGLRLVRLAHAAWAKSSLAPVARPHIDALAAEVDETVHLAQLDGGQVLYVDKRNAGERIEMYSQAGKVGPAYCTGVGKAMLAFLPPEELDVALRHQSFHRFTPATLAHEAALRAELEDIRRDGLAFDREEHEPGIVCIAAPVLSSGGRPLGAVSVTSSTARRSIEDLVHLAPKLRSAVQAISRDAEAWRFPDDPPTPRTEKD